jgi:hypothetical protein
VQNQQRAINPWNLYYQLVHKKSTPPVTHLICRESRNQSLRYYEVFWIPFAFSNHKQCLYIDFSRDRIQCHLEELIQNNKHFGVCSVGEGKEFYGAIQCLELTIRVWHQPDGERALDDAWNVLQRFSGLKELYLRNPSTLLLFGAPSHLASIKAASVSLYKGRFEKEREKNPHFCVPKITFCDPE